MIRTLALACLVALSLMAPTVSSAQTPVDATSGVTFTASPDHAATNEDGSPMVTGYELRIVRLDAQGVLFLSYQLGKPAPAPNGDITVKPISALSTLTRAVQFVARVSAIGPGGEGVSGLSDPFVYPFAPPAQPGAPGVPRLGP